MDNSDIKKAAGKKKALTSEIASRHTDPNFYGALSFLPNPDTVLRRLGKSHEAFDAIFSDAHVLGELRSVRSGLLGFEYRVQAGGETPADMRAHELCEKYMKQRPAPGMRWPDVLWNIATGVFYGYRAHEVVWEKQDGFLMPGKLLDRPNRRFCFGIDNELRLKTRANSMNGEPVGDRKFLVSRHMPSAENPYGVAVFSSCFWPYTFKHGGFKYFVKFCEKYGIPWAIGKHPRGTPEPEINNLVDALANMVEDGVAAIPDDGSVELLSSKSNGQLPQERLIQACNSEMSKALTSQTLATEIQGEGSRAAAETHRGREQGVQESDREIVCDVMNELFAWITEINIAGAVPPTFEFYEEEEVQISTAEFIAKARESVDVPKAWAHNKMQIPIPEEGEEVLSRTGDAPAAIPPIGPPEFNGHNCPKCSHDFAAGEDDIDRLAGQAADDAGALVADMAAPIRQLLDESETLMEFRDGLVKMYPAIDDQRLGELSEQALLVGLLKGVSDAQ